MKRSSIWTAIIVILAVSTASGCSGMGTNGNQTQPGTTADLVPSATPQPSHTPTATLTLTPEPTETPTITPTPTPGVGSSIEAPDGSRMLFIPAGEFIMGTNAGNEDEAPAHAVYLDAFWIGETELTCDRFMAFVEETGYQHPLSSPQHEWYGYYADHCLDRPDHPALVSWHAANAYCDWAGLRLPTEAEWEKAARGGLEGKKYPWGDEAPVCELGAENGAMYYDGVNCAGGRTAPVKSFQPNGYGLFDMAGNVSEWVSDLYLKFYYAPDNYESTPYENPQGPETGFYQINRGGSADRDVTYLRCASRYETVGANYAGFRCAVSAGE